MKPDGIKLSRGSRLRHHCDEAQSEQLGEISFRNRRRARGRLDQHGIGADLLIAQSIEEKRAGEPMLKAAGGMRALVFQVECNARHLRQFDPY
ncbi:hypothetical protein RLDS_12435 [Sphingobium lactosutens DS20]|uniref:Uncharacterized protein n=1 Tax=Sphingobium lactosutens DS20 TaxID=1331060 RepID=T0HPL2_9SPHN|nr:hypothetical protein RLDS_12435 [Sphingobium lactosutens DS20]